MEAELGESGQACPYLAAAGLSQLDDAEWRAVTVQASALLLFQSRFSPPSPKPQRGAVGDPSLSADEGKFVRPAHLRAVSAESKAAHQLAALALAELPGTAKRGRYTLPNDVKSAISTMLRYGTHLPELRDSQIAKMHSLARACLPITDRMRRTLAPLRPPSVRAVSDRMNVAFALVLAKALHWPHIWIGRALLVWFPITGIMESTGVLRACEER
jgi:hypothetical protein